MFLKVVFFVKNRQGKKKKKKKKIDHNKITTIV